MADFHRRYLRKIGRPILVLLLTLVAIIAAILLDFFFVKLFNFTYSPFEDVVLIICVTVLVAPLLSWYFFGLFFKLDKLETEMAFLAATDSLTNTRNRGYFYQEVSQALLAFYQNTSLSEQNTSLSVQEEENSDELPAFIALDLDNLKPTNDLLGHAAGDKVLAALGAILLEVAPKPNVVGRLGGDEFVIFLMDTQISAKSLAEEILNRVRSENVVFDGDPLSISVSIGVSYIYGADEHSIDMAMKAADQALYKVKRAGRDGFAMGNTDH